MRIMILGGTGMLGHRLFKTCSELWQTMATVRRADTQSALLSQYAHSGTSIQGVDARAPETVRRVLAEYEPDVVVNAVGIVKQSPMASDPVSSITVNALFPHQLCDMCEKLGIRLIHISTDCVFSGLKGHYTEADVSDAEDLYGRTKFLGEVDAPHCVTLRTSMIGRELGGQRGLLEWFLAQRGREVRGYRRAVFSGLTTIALSKVIAEAVIPHTELQGVWHVAANPIDKYRLLSLINEAHQLGIVIHPDDGVVCDRSLDGTRFEMATGFVPPDWERMIEETVSDRTPYDELRRLHAHG